ncbi:MAG: hypothetical protein HYW26_02910 [Candidatus Aenigmarchaeota archaeon]|nr:hypothetical protein [Candidatus Aenigmarchaeota archaeon]
MKSVYLVSADSKQKAEDALKKDDLVSRGSILIRLASSLDMKEDGYFIVLDASEQALKQAEQLLKGIAEIYKDSETVLKRIQEQEDRATEGFGNILG